MGLFFGRALTGIVLATTLPGCQVIKTAQMGSRVQACLEKIQTNPAYHGILKHKPLDGRVTPTAEQLQDQEIPTPEEVNTLIAIHNDAAPCRIRAIEDASSVIPAMIPYAVNAYQQSDLISADLMHRKITWGEANRRLELLKAETTIKAFSAQTQAEEQARKQFADTAVNVVDGILKLGLAALAVWSAQQRAAFYPPTLINSPYKSIRPVVSDCWLSQIGTTGVSSIRCSSQ